MTYFFLETSHMVLDIGCDKIYDSLLFIFELKGCFWPFLTV